MEQRIIMSISKFINLSLQALAVGLAVISPAAASSTATKTPNNVAWRCNMDGAIVYIAKSGIRYSMINSDGEDAGPRTASDGARYRADHFGFNSQWLEGNLYYNISFSPTSGVFREAINDNISTYRCQRVPWSTIVRINAKRIN
jgi:hypothetical protein